METVPTSNVGRTGLAGESDFVPVVRTHTPTPVVIASCRRKSLRNDHHHGLHVTNTGRSKFPRNTGIAIPTTNRNRTGSRNPDRN